MKINEIFHSIQGEGKYTGKNALFLRTSGCTLDCKFCDTKYHKQGEERDVEDLIAQIESFNTYNLVITGGEPLLHQEELYEIIKDLPHFVTVETNGTVMPNEEMLSRVDHWSVSPKLATSGNNLDKRMNYDVLTTVELFNAIYKFVITNENDIKEIIAISKRIGLPENKIWLMPEGTTAKEIIHKSPKVVELCKQHNFNFSSRLHILIWNTKKGV